MTIKRSSFIEGEVIENRKWTERLYSLTIHADQMPFKAGQFVRLQSTIGGEVITKSYSLVNAPHEQDMEVFYTTVPNGRLSNALASLQKGDFLEVSQPANGFFVLDEIPKSRHLWMFATGTGLGPYISILKTPEIWDSFEKIFLVHGVSLVKELVYKDLIEKWQDEYPEQFQYISCVTREDNPAGLKGRMTDLLTTGVLEQHAHLDICKENSHVMLCGNHNMINDMKKILGDRDMSKHLRHKAGHITTEQYF